MNKSGDTRNSQETCKCYKPEYHHSRTQDWIVAHLRQKETQGKNLGQYRYCLINGIFNTLAPLQSCRCQIIEILLNMHLKSVQPLGHTLWIWNISYVEISTYFNLLCNYSQNYLLIRISPPPKKKIPTTHFHSQQCSCFHWLYICINQTQLTFLDTVEMGLITDMQTYKSLNLVQHLFHNTLHCTL